MAWIELHQAVWTHRKTVLLAEALGIPETYAAAHMIRLWTWALDNAPDGDLSKLPAHVVAYGAAWTGDAESFCAAIVTAGWVDRTDDGLVLHDWDDYAGRLVQRRAENAERMRQARATRAASFKERAAHVQRTFDARAGATGPNRTGPDPTQPDTTGPDRTGSTQISSTPDVPERGSTAARAATPTPSGDAGYAIFQYYRERIQPTAREPIEKTRQKISARLAHWSPEQLRMAVDHFATDTWYMAHNAHQGAAWFFATDERIEQFVCMTSRPEGTNGTTGDQRAGGVRPPHRAAGGTGRVAPKSFERPLDDEQRARLRLIGHRADPNG